MGRRTLRLRDRRARPLRFVTTDCGCFVPLSHKLNPDGYFRKRWGDGPGGKVIEMFHRTYKFDAILGGAEGTCSFSSSPKQRLTGRQRFLVI